MHYDERYPPRGRLYLFLEKSTRGADKGMVMGPSAPDMYIKYLNLIFVSFLLILFRSLVLIGLRDPLFLT